jgi:hypothetical protein
MYVVLAIWPLYVSNVMMQEHQLLKILTKSMFCREMSPQLTLLFLPLYRAPFCFFPCTEPPLNIHESLSCLIRSKEKRQLAVTIMEYRCSGCQTCYSLFHIKSNYVVNCPLLLGHWHSYRVRQPTSGNSYSNYKNLQPLLRDHPSAGSEVTKLCSLLRAIAQSVQYRWMSML